MIDQLDHAILRILTNDGRRTQREIGVEVGLSANAVGARVNRLIERGIITGIHAKVDHAKLGRSMEVTIDIWREERSEPESMERVVSDDDRITECFYLTGPLDFRLRAIVASADDLNDLLNRLKTEANVRQTDSRIVLEHLEVPAS
ncbi:MAG: Lrp/AsnC family transcriptional regulator [Acidimicrobiales bacterium]